MLNCDSFTYMSVFHDLFLFFCRKMKFSFQQLTPGKYRQCLKQVRDLNKHLGHDGGFIEKLVECNTAVILSNEIAG